MLQTNINICTVSSSVIRRVPSLVHSSSRSGLLFFNKSLQKPIGSIGLDMVLSFCYASSMVLQLSDTLTTDIPLDRDSEEPIYQQLIRHFQYQISSGRLQPGTRLPPSRDLARELGIGRISVVSAYNELQSKGLISAHPGRGTFVSGGEQTRKVTPKNHHQSQPAPHQNMREILRLAQKPGVIAFNCGAPPDEFLPVEAFRSALDTVLHRDGAAAITYEDPEGYMPLRTAVRDFITSQGIDTRAENILITGGAQQALDVVLQAMLAPGDAVITTSPTYLGFLDIAHVRRITPVGIPMNNEGICLDTLEDLLIDYHPKLLYINPTFHNPTGSTMSIHRRRQLLRLAQQYDLMILEDAVYQELHFDEPAPPPLKALDEAGIVLHASSFSKILLPGTRIGYIVTEGYARDRILRVKQAADICSPALIQRAVHLYMKRGNLPGHLDRIRHVLRDRRDAAVEAARKYLSDEWAWKVPKGGLYMWLELPASGPTAAELYMNAIDYGVAYAMGTLFHTNGEGARHIRINFGSYPPEKIREGFRRLSAAWEDFQINNIQRRPIL